MSGRSPVDGSESRFMLIEEYAALSHQSLIQIRNLHSQGELPVKPIRMGKGRRLLWDRAEVNAYIDGLLAARQA